MSKEKGRMAFITFSTIDKSLFLIRTLTWVDSSGVNPTFDESYVVLTILFVNNNCWLLVS